MEKLVPKFKNAAPTTIQSLILWFTSRATFRGSWFGNKIKVIAEITDFQIWIKENFPKSKLFYKREDLWREIVQQNNGDRRIIELGVAWGYTTNWFLTKGFPIRKNNQTSRKKSPKVKIDAFDLFTGLPEAWRNHPKNYFSNNGVVPKIRDERVTFHIGYVENEILKLKLSTNDNLIILFDLDLFEPTLSAFNYLKANLKKGDVLYFDEAFDKSERAIIVEHLLESFWCSPIGHTSLSICLKIESKR